MLCERQVKICRIGHVCIGIQNLWNRNHVYKNEWGEEKDPKILNIRSAKCHPSETYFGEGVAYRLKARACGNSASPKSY